MLGRPAPNSYVGYVGIARGVHCRNAVLLVVAPQLSTNLSNPLRIASDKALGALGERRRDTTRLALMPPPTIAKLVGAALLRRVPWAGDDDAALRTTHAFTLGERLQQLDTFVEGWKARMHGDPKADPPALPIAPPASLFDGSASDFANDSGGGGGRPKRARTT